MNAERRNLAVNEQKALGFLLLFFLVLIYKATVWDPYFSPPVIVPREVVESPPPPSAAVPTTLPTPPSVATTSGVTSPPFTPYPSDAQIRSKGGIVVRTRKLNVGLSLLGGRITELSLLDHRATNEPGSPPLNIVEHVEFRPFPGGLSTGGASDAWVEYRLERSSLGAAPDQRDLFHVSHLDGEFVLAGVLPDGRSVRKIFRFRPQGYLFDIDVQLGSAPRDGSRLGLEWTKLIPKDSPSLLDVYDTAGLVHFDGVKLVRTRFDKLIGEQTVLGNVRWASLTDKYFLVTIVSPSSPLPGTVFHTTDLFGIRLDGEAGGGSFQVFAGPKSYRALREAGFELHRNINFGIFAFLSVPLLVLLQTFYQILGNYGLAIILLTILVKTALLPLTVASFKQIRAMGELKPEIDRIQKEVKDKQQRQMEQMSLYKKRGVNPLGGCFPMLVQIPIFLGLYNALLAAIELRHARFALWIADLSAPEGLMIGGVGIPVLVILFVISMLVQQWITPTVGMDPMQRKMMMAMPIVFGFMFIAFPAGLTLYWLVSNIISIGQTKMLQTGGHRSALLVTLALSGALLLFSFGLTRI